jgi:hypothetical protein
MQICSQHLQALEGEEVIPCVGCLGVSAVSDLIKEVDNALFNNTAES